LAPNDPTLPLHTHLHTLLTPSTRKRLPQRGFVQVGFWEIKFRGTESGNVVPGAFTPVLAKHSKSFSLIDCIAVGVDRMQRNFEPMRKHVDGKEVS